MAANDILFVSNENGVTERKPAHKTGRLCVSYSNKYNKHTYKIYGVLSHRPFIPFKFNDFYEAIEVAEYLEKVYDGFLDLWQADPLMNVVLITRFSVEGGSRIFVALNTLKGQDIISKRDFFQAVNGEYDVPAVSAPIISDKQTPRTEPKTRISSLISSFVSGFLGS